MNYTYCHVCGKPVLYRGYGRPPTVHPGECRRAHRARLVRELRKAAKK